MSGEPRRVPGVLVAHGNMAKELRATAEIIAGKADDIPCLTNNDRTPDALAEEIGKALDERGPGTILMVDLAGGSCFSASMKAVRTRPGIHVIAGVNLPLLLDFIQNREALPAAELKAHLVERGHAGLKAVTSGE